MYKVLDKHTIENKLLLHLSVVKRRYETKSCLIKLINNILHKLKTGIQWHMPVNRGYRQHFSQMIL